MNVDFFDQAYRTEEARKDLEFGICDPAPEEKRPAYTTTNASGPHKWCAKVNNPASEEIIFIPIDNNFDFRDSEGQKESSCDGMMLLEKHSSLCFVELKNKRKQWITEAVDQLKATIAKFNANHDYKLFTRRLAYACNRRKPLVNNSHREQQQEFKRETHFTLHLSYNIDIPVSASVENLPEPTEDL